MKDLKTFVFQTILLTVFFTIALLVFFPPERPLHFHHDHRDGHTHETISPSEKQNTKLENTPPLNLQEGERIIDSYIQDLFTSSGDDKQLHEAAITELQAKERLELVCSYYSDICSIMERKTSYSEVERYYYQILIIYMISSLDKHRQIPTQGSMRDIVSKIIMYQDEKARRGSAGTTHIRMNTIKMNTLDEFRNVLTHEMAGHIHDLGVIKQSNPPYLVKDYTEFNRPAFGPNDRSLQFYKISRDGESTRKADSTHLDFVSGYSMVNIFEDFAEFSNARINHREPLKLLASKNNKIKQKYDLFEQMFGDRRVNDDTEALTRFDGTKRVFDTTKKRK